MNIFKNFSYGLLAFMVSFFSGAANVYASPLSLSSVPLFTGNPITSNVFFQMDDSGSMEWEVMARPHWFSCSYDSNIPVHPGSGDCGDLNAAGLVASYDDLNNFVFFYQMFNNSDDAYSFSCDDPQTLSNYESCVSSQAIDADWRVRSADLNVIYYNPDVQYAPWQGTGMTNASFTAALSDPQPGKAGNTVSRSLAGFVYEVWIDDRGFTTSVGVDRPRRGTNINANIIPNKIVDLWDSHYQITVNASGYTVKKISYSPSVSGLNPQTPVTVTDPKELQLALGTNASGSARTIAETQQNVANWYQYSRRRSFVAKGATAAVMTGKPGFRYGLGLFQNGLFKEMPAANVTNFVSHNTSVLSDFFDYVWTTTNTSLRTGLERTGEYYKGNLSGKSSPIIAECQQNFTVLMTDGFWNGVDPNVSDADGDGHDNTAADVAKYYYDQDLRTDLDNKVLKSTNRTPVELNDTNTKQHMVTFTAAFGVEGSLTDTNADGWPDPLLLENGNWGAPNLSDQAKIDDLWHAAFNSKGDFVSARTPDDLVNGLDAALGAISVRTGAASSLASNSTNLNSGTALYQALFVSGEWSGDIRKLQVSDGNASSGVCKNIKRGSVCTTPAWNARAKLDAQDYRSTVSGGRQILSYNPVSNTGISFAFPASYNTLVGGTNDSTKLSDGQIQALLTNAPNAANTGVTTEIAENQSFGNDVVAFLRGDRSQEGTGRGFRIRGSKLGDVIHSGPVFVGKPNFNYSDTLESVSYSSFVTSNASRTKMIYVAGNDGMLHAFDDTTGSEKLAFVPSAVYSNLPKLAQSSYSHEYFVDGSPSIGDAFYNSAWHTVLVGGLNAGGKSVYALDVTDPSTFKEANASNLVLWEYTDADLGYTYGTPTIVKMNNGQWAAVFGNGYNSAGTGQSAVYIVNLETGALIKKILTGVGSALAPNGISHVTPIDTNGDAIADYLFGGDLLGNMWKFDVTNRDPSKWDVAYKTGSGNNAVPAPIFTATSPSGVPQPITVAPEVLSHPDSSRDGFLVLFGTGKYLELTDNTSLNQETQTFYAIWDPNETSLTTISKLNDLLQQKVTEEASASFDLDGDGTDDITRDVRITTEHTVDWTQHKGWYLDLINTQAKSPTPTNMGERQVTRPVVRNNTVFFTTLMPSGNPCDAGGTGWIMGLDAASGARKPTSVFDVNNDGDVDDKDRYSSAVVSGVKIVGFISDPRFIGDSGKDHGFISTTASDKPEELTTDGSSNSERVSWRQIINE